MGEGGGGLFVVFKIISLIGVFAVSFMGGLLPIKLSKWFDADKTLSYANCVSGGILLGASLIHLLPDAEDVSFQKFPLAHLCCGCGFFIAFILEKVMFHHEHEHQSKGDTENEQHGHQHPAFETQHLPTEESEEDELSKRQVVELSSFVEEDSDTSITTLVESNKLPSATLTESLIIPDKRKPTNGEASHSNAPYILFAVLALESLISGSALGVSGTTLGMFVVFVAIITHIWAESFALAASLLKAKFPLAKVHKMNVIFSAVTPLGGLIGLALNSVLEGKVAIIISSVLISFAAGTFLYVAIVEIMAEEFASDQNKWTKLNLMLLGFAFMSILAVWI